MKFAIITLLFAGACVAIAKDTTTPCGFSSSLESLVKSINGPLAGLTQSLDGKSYEDGSKCSEVDKGLKTVLSLILQGIPAVVDDLLSGVIVPLGIPSDLLENLLEPAADLLNLASPSGPGMAPGSPSSMAPGSPSGPGMEPEEWLEDLLDRLTSDNPAGEGLLAILGANPQTLGLDTQIVDAFDGDIEAAGAALTKLVDGITGESDSTVSDLPGSLGQIVSSLSGDDASSLLSEYLPSSVVEIITSAGGLGSALTSGLQGSNNGVLTQLKSIIGSSFDPSSLLKSIFSTVSSSFSIPYSFITGFFSGDGSSSSSGGSTPPGSTSTPGSESSASANGDMSVTNGGNGNVQTSVHTVASQPQYTFETFTIAP